MHTLLLSTFLVLVRSEWESIFSCRVASIFDVLLTPYDKPATKNGFNRESILQYEITPLRSLHTEIDKMPHRCGFIKKFDERRNKNNIETLWLSVY